MLGKYRNRDISRLEGFSDAVFAFAATLLVVSLEVPGTFDELIDQLYGFGAFAITFGALIAIWTVHNAFYRRYGLHDGWTVFLNSTLLFVVLFYVFPLKFLTEGFFSRVLGIGSAGIEVAGYGELGKVFAIYSSGFAAVFLTVALMYWRAWMAREELKLVGREVSEAAFLARHYLLFFLVGLVSIALALTEVGIWFGMPGIIYFLLGPLCFIHSRWSGH